MSPLSSSLTILSAPVHRDVLHLPTSSLHWRRRYCTRHRRRSYGLFLNKILHSVLGRHVAFLKVRLFDLYCTWLEADSFYAIALAVVLSSVLGRPADRRCGRHRAVQRDAESARPSYYLHNSTRPRRPPLLPRPSQPQEVRNQSRLRFPPQ
jgi:hypothetical protein